MSGSPSLAGKIGNQVGNFFYSVKDSLISVPTVSRFEQKRTLIPSEFVKAGDYLVTTYPSWQWSLGFEGVAHKQKKYLGGPKKQCLLLRNVPVKSPSKIAAAIMDEEEIIDGDWVCPKTKETIESSSADVSTSANQGAKHKTLTDTDDDDVVPQPVSENHRTYDIYITYDKVYAVPRVWLVGYDAANNPLNAQQVCEDISQDHAGDTVTWDPHPHEDFPAASIHPCRHAEVMKSLLDTMEANGATVAVDHYLLVFLKFITAIIPTIEYI